ncbi:hypothetical protein HPB48_009517 [Haemaphysalis longicornis]|uniref:Uncharacterized protein n=1 Tax=Haemaphysalis longicornis TaxID=44386 RepID=A0A9J6GG28_HAELO|nr:hypothetical protein HPB48_009517 [Haemaphysalis longicornis]
MTARKPPDDGGRSPESNPFHCFPSDLVEDLIETVIQMSPRARDKLTPDVRVDHLSVRGKLLPTLSGQRLTFYEQPAFLATCAAVGAG